MKANLKNIIIFILIIGVVIVGSSYLMDQTGEEDKLTYSQLIKIFEMDLVKTFRIDETDTIIFEEYQVEKDQNGNFLFGEDGNYKFILNEKGERKTVEKTYQFSYMLQVERILYIAEGNVNLVSYDLEPMAETPWYLAYLPYASDFRWWSR